MQQATGLNPLPLNSLLEVLPDGIAFVDEYGVICHVNERLESLTGYARDFLVGQAVDVLLQSRYQDANAARRRGLARDPPSRAQAKPVELGYSLLCQDGRELTVDVARAPFALDGKTWTVVAVRDDSAQKPAGHVPTEAELHAIAAELAGAEALANSEQRFRLAFENNMAGMIFVDLEDRVLAVNDSFCKMVGRSREEIVDKGAAPFTHPKGHRIAKEVHGRLASGEADQVSYVDRYVHKDGRTILVEVSKSRARDAAGATLYFLISVRDVTQERALSAQLSHQALHDSLTGLANRVVFEDWPESQNLIHAHESLAPIRRRWRWGSAIQCGSEMTRVGDCSLANASRCSRSSSRLRPQRSIAGSTKRSSMQDERPGSRATNPTSSPGRAGGSVSSRLSSRR